MKNKIKEVKIYGLVLSILGILLLVPVWMKIFSYGIPNNQFFRMLFENSFKFPNIDWFLWVVMLGFAIVTLSRRRQKDITLSFLTIVIGFIWYLSQIGKVSSGLAFIFLISAILANTIKAVLFLFKQQSEVLPPPPSAGQ